MFKKSSEFDMNTNVNDCFGINFYTIIPGNFVPMRSVACTRKVNAMLCEARSTKKTGAFEKQ